jgi:hypothetical protein
MGPSSRSSAFLPFVALLAFGTLVACGTADEEPPVGPAPSEPIVYDASAQTEQEVGIAKWGYRADDSATVFRGYGHRNELMVEIRQTFTQSDPRTKTFAMQMTGPVASGTERIDFVAQWTKDGETMEYVDDVRENTFVQGSVASRILARLAPDAAAMAAAAPSAGGTSLTKSVRPLDQTPGLVQPSEDPLLVCCSQVTREAAGMSAIPGTECPLVTPSNRSLVPHGVAPHLEGAGDLAPKAIVLGPGGQPVVQSPWSGPYNIVDHHCHNAAALNSSLTDGYIACVARSSTTTTQGHTINWGPDPSKAGTAGAFCAYEPQSNGGTVQSNSVCCWQGNAAADGTPMFDTAGAQGCVSKLCLGQADFPGWFRGWFVTPPQAFPAGDTPPVPNDCPGSTSTGSACGSCCTAQAKNVQSLFGSAGASYVQQIEDYRTRCAMGCLERELQRQEQAAASRGCAASAFSALRARTNASSCASGR